MSATRILISLSMLWLLSTASCATKPDPACCDPQSDDSSSEADQEKKLSLDSLTEVAKRFSTANKANQVARTVLTDPTAHRLPPNAFLVGIEKGNADKLKAPKLNRGLDLTHITKKAGEKLGKTLQDERAMFVSHIVETGDAAPIYNLYADNGIADPWKAGTDGLELLRKRIETISAEAKPTHLILWVTGWNNTQAESIDSLVALDANLRAAAKSNPGAEPFKPIYVAVSWTSYFPGLGSLFGRSSFTTKSNDADEVGAVWGGRLVNGVFMPLKQTLPSHPKVVLIGHSFGARVVTWAAFSAAGDLTGAHTDRVDAVIGLQGAFPVNRFTDHGADGSPYANFTSASRRFLYTASSQDKAVGIAAWSTYIGNREACDTVKSNPATFDIFGVKSRRNVLPIELYKSLPPGDWAKVAWVNCSSIVNSHNDVVSDVTLSGEDRPNLSVGDLVWQVCK